MPERAIPCASEKAALDAFSSRIRELDPDVLTGWNVIDFDLSVLNRIARRVGASLQIGRDAGAIRLRPAQGYFGSGQASIPGRLVLDGMDLVRGAFLRFEDYSLDSVARAVLGESKIELGASGNRAQDIEARFHDDLAAFARYARTDARLALEIVEQLDARHRSGGSLPPHGHDAGPRFGQHRLVRLSLSDRARQAPDRGAERAFPRCAGVPGAAPGRRPRLRTGHRASSKTYGCSTSRASIQASSARSTSIP